MLYIRTDANEEIATGHIMRCMTIAHKISDMGEKVVFLVKDDTSIAILKKTYDYIKINASDETEEILSILEKTEKNKILLDLYSITANYMSQIRERAKVITFDDMFEEKYPADIIINYNIYYKKFNYRERYPSQNTRLLLGTDYVPLRDEFKPHPRVIADIKNITIICGGGDKYHILADIADKIKTLKEYHFTIIAGALNRDYDKLKCIANKHDHITILKNVTNMGELMSKMDLIISAASTVLYECCSMAVPTIYFTLADNQIYDAEAFSADGTMLYAGDIRENRNAVLNNIILTINRLSANKNLLNKMRTNMQNIVDGKGAFRIAEAIHSLEEITI